MTSHDVRDMLDLPQEGAARPIKKQKVAAPRPVLKGLAREVQNLSGDNPIAIVPEGSIFKKRRFASRKPAAKWELRPFRNSARSDDSLILRHWRRLDEKRKLPPQPAGENRDSATQTMEGVVGGEEQMEDSGFAKFNVQVELFDYSPEEYESRLRSEDWTKDETDYLMKMVSQFDLRWPIIWDRYEYEPPIPEQAPSEADGNARAIIVAPKTRSMEDLKARYYAVTATMMVIRKPPIKMNSAEFSLHEVMLNFNPEQEKARKIFAENSFLRTKEEAREEESLLLELKRINARSERFSDERRELYARLDAPSSSSHTNNFTSSVGLGQLLQQLMSMDKSKKQRKSIMGGEGISPAGPSGPTQQNPDHRRESSARESISGPSAPNNKKGPPNPAERRQLSKEEEEMYGVSRHERIGTSGPAFRQEKIFKPLLAKSMNQQKIINNVLTELEIPPRLIMPTADVGESYDGLLTSINNLLDCRKVADKLTAEINIARAQKAERERLARESENAGEGGDVGAGAETVVGTGGKGNSGAPGSVNGTTTTTTTGPGPTNSEPRNEEKAGSPTASVKGVAHKRSASVMSAVSDKSAKRQKK
ncbi:hypothetical protein HYALB_00010463 [Hymenoscyphus albidus]|uniref:SWR1-complex protein 4 n=1 Tax=Hymenoscyphus albidus TaxID=595503 RepID=A0A9N9Q6A6_9HELO|nr:hypothetical protein HYALB_00010463 [Hymenoscyphus albidus]